MGIKPNIRKVDISTAKIYIPEKSTFPFNEPIFLEVSPFIADDSVIYADTKTEFPTIPGVYQCNIVNTDENGTVSLSGFVRLWPAVK